MDYILYEQKGQTGIITINREKALNALNSQVLDELNTTLDAVNLDEVRCLILTGAGMAKQMIYTARNIKADEAYRIGLVNAVYTQEELLPAAEKMAAGIAKNAPIAVRNCKKAINEGLDLDMDAAVALEEKLFGDCFESEDQKYGMAFFLDKNKEKVKEPFKNR